MKLGKHIIDYRDISKDVLEQLQRGAFLTVGTGKETNVMTIGWGQIGIMWGVPVFVAPVRLSRYTYSLLKDTDDFSVSVPARAEMTKELSYCGTKSGSDVNKIRALGLKTEKAEKISTPVIGGCRYHFECKILSRVELCDDNFTKEFKDRFYKDSNYHVLFYGEILSCYITD